MSSFRGEHYRTDSAGRVALKVITGPSSVQYKYLDYTGAYQTTTVNLETLNVKTAFACSGVVEYTGTATVPASIVLPNNLQYQFDYETSPGNTGYYTGRLHRVTLPTGGFNQYDYTGANDGVNCADGTTLSMSRTVSDGTNSATWNYLRNTATLTTTITTPKLVDTANAFDTVVTFSSSGQEIKRQIYPNSPGSGTPLRTISTTWASNGTPSEVQTFLEDGTTQSKVLTTFDSNGLLDNESEYDFGASFPFRTTSLTYNTSSNYTNLNILDLITSKQIAGGGAIQYRQDITYDGVALSNCPTGAAQHNESTYPCTFNYRGNPTSVTTYQNPGGPTGGITKNFTYDWFGNLRSAQLNCCQTKTWQYSLVTQYSQPDSVTSGTAPNQLTTSATYYMPIGQIETFTDENNLVTNFSYDTLRRLTQVSQTEGGTNLGGTVSYSYDDIDHTATTTTQVDSTKSVKQITAVDALGRPNLSTIEDASNNVYSKVNTAYDLAGRAYQTSNPYTGTQSSYFTTTQFDVLGRPISITLPDNSTTRNSYVLNTATVTDPTGKQRKSVLDAVGRLSGVYEPDPTNGNSLTLQTSYTYNVLDELTQVVQGAQTRSYVYDALGRLNSATTPEAGRVCFGTVSGSTCNSNGYDNFDNLLTRTDARGVVTSYGHDGLNRLTTIGYNVSNAPGVPATASIGLTYGTSAAQFNNGRLITMTDGSGSENYTYNNLGQLTQLQKTVGTQTFAIGYSYNVGNELTQITYPSGRVVQQSVDPIGRLCEVAPSTTGCGTAATPYVTGYSYNAASLATGLKYGNGIFGSFGFSPDRLELTCLDYSTTNRTGNCTHDSTSKFGLTYSYGVAGSNNSQISSISDYVQEGRSITYTYDALHRVTNAATTGSAGYPTWGLAESYDRYGNRTAQSISSGCTGISCPTNTVSPGATTNRLTDAAYAYDLSGNMTKDGMNTLTYDGEEHAVTASGNLGSGTYTYDGNSLRVKKVAGGTTTVYIFSGAKVIAEYANGAVPTSPTREYVYGGGALIARIDSSGIKYYHQDHLSNRIMTSSSGSVAAEVGHFPFGESWYNSTNDKLYFTTYEYDSESGNHYAMARYHVSRLGRLSSPDPIAGSTANPQSLNRYSYSTNDPANMTDPSGAMAGCNTAQTEPREKSIEVSGDGGPSNGDNWDGDWDASPPPQSGCGTHVNPFGAGSDGAFMDGADVTELLADAPGILGSGASVEDAWLSGPFDGGFQIGQLNYEQICGDTTYSNGSGGGITVHGNCQDFVTRTGSVLDSVTDSTITARTDAAVQVALHALTIADCASLFGNGINPEELLKLLASPGSALGTISNSDFGAAGTVAVTAPIVGPTIPTSPGQSILFGAAEHVGPTFSGANIVVNNNSSAPFMAGWTGTKTATGVHLGGAYSDSDLNAGTIIHELGHAANYIFGPGSSAILNDQDNPVISGVNTNIVMKHCF